MKNSVLLVATFFLVGFLNAQVVFEEDFQDQAFPEGTIFYDFDQRTDLMIWQGFTIEDMMNWYVFSHYSEPDNYNAWSTGFSSTYVAGEVDNWFIFPAINIPPQSTLYYDARRTATANNNPFPEYVRVMISTTGTDTSDFVVMDEYQTLSNAWNTMSVSLENYAGMPVYLAFRNFGEHGVHMLVDNISIVSEATIIDDVEIVEALPQNFYLQPGTSDLTIKFNNIGTSIIQSIDVGWSVDGGLTFETTTLSGLNVGYNEAYQTVLYGFINLSETGGYEILIRLSNPNGNIDPTPENNEITRLVTVILNSGTRKVMLEEFTGTWCGWCPRGAIVMRDILLDYPEQVIGLAYHKGDPMEIEEYEELVGEIPMVNGYPSGSIDRFPFDMQAFYPMSLGTDVWEEKILERLGHPTPLNIAGNIAYDAVSKELTVTVDVDFVSADIGEFRVNCILTESGITGYPQANAYNNDPTTYPELYQAGDPIIDWEHNYVVRAMLGGPFGADDVIPYEVNAGENYAHIFNYMVPDEFVPENMNMIIYVSKHPEDFTLGRNILNASEYHLIDYITGIETESIREISLYPNPAEDMVCISNIQNAMVSMYDLNGREVLKKAIVQPNNPIDVSFLKQGTYIVEIESMQELHTLKVHILR
nr:Omp28-related outer membrane protein [Bacteroidota bacterium]